MNLGGARGSRGGREPLPKGARRRHALAQWRWLVPGLRVKRFGFQLALGCLLIIIGFYQYARVGPGRAFYSQVGQTLSNIAIPGLPSWVLGAMVVGAGVWLAWSAVIRLNRSILAAMASQPGDTLETLFRKRTLGRGPRVVAIGGGTGLSNLLSGLKVFTANLSAIVAVTDDGGSSGRLRRSLGMPAPGDLTDCIAALSDSPALAKLLLHRFQRGDGLSGHTFGNLLLATLADQRGDFAEAILAVNDILNVRGRVFPATATPATLIATIEGGDQVAGESTLRERENRGAIRRMQLDPPDVRAVPGAKEAVSQADLIVLGPGSLYTSVTPPLLIPDLAAAIRVARAPVVYVCNIMTEAGETDGLSALGHVRAVQEHLGRSPDVVLLNNAPISEETLARYRLEGAERLEVDETALMQVGIRVVFAPLTRRGQGQHDPRALAVALVRLLLEGRLPSASA